jgi:hypothetical protein
LLCGHEYRSASLCWQQLTRNRDFRFALEDVSQSIERGCMLTQALSFIECEQRDGSGRPVYDHPADNGSFLVIHEIDQWNHFSYCYLAFIPAGLRTHL